MHRNVIVLFALCLFSMWSCKEKSTAPSETFTIDGIVIYDESPLPNANVSVDNNDNLSTQTDQNGYFKVTGVPEGDHSLVTNKSFDNGSFVENSSIIEVTSDLSIDNIVLPDPINLFPPSAISDKSMTLNWTKSSDADFREYKIYRHLSSGLDESTGELVHVSTSRDDTVFTDTGLSPLSTYFYRVYVMNSYGRLGGSNIQSGKTENLEVIQNGDFEVLNSVTNFPEQWQVWNNAPFITLDETETYSGNFSVKIEMDNSSPPHNPVYQNIDPTLLVEGGRYHLSYWLKVDSLDNWAGFWTNIRSESWSWTLNINQTYGPAVGFEWREFTYDFTVPSGLNSSNILIEFYFEVPKSNFRGWLDKVSLIKLD